MSAKVITLPKRPPRGLGKDGKPLEGTIQAEIMRRAHEHAWCQLWRNNTGQLKDERGVPVTYGLAPGSSDLIGVVKVARLVAGYSEVRGVGRFVAIEVKRPGKTPTKEQLEFIDRVRAMGGAATWTDNAADALAFLHRVREGIE